MTQQIISESHNGSLDCYGIHSMKFHWAYLVSMLLRCSFIKKKNLTYEKLYIVNVCNRMNLEISVCWWYHHHNQRHQTIYHLEKFPPTLLFISIFRVIKTLNIKSSLYGGRNKQPRWLFSCSLSISTHLVPASATICSPDWPSLLIIGRT